MAFINTVCTQIEQILPILIDNQKDHPVTLNKCVLGYALTDIKGYEDKIFAIHDCDEFTTRILNEGSEFDSFFMLNTVINTTKESNTQLSGPCLQYVDFKKKSIFESNMPIAHTISAVRAMKKGFAESICKGILSYDTFVIQYMLTLTIFSSSLIQNLDKSYITSLPNRGTFKNQLKTLYLTTCPK